MNTENNIYHPQNHVRIVTAASLFDGHDASINVMRRIMQSNGVEVVHLGHNRSAYEIVTCAIQEDAQAIAVTSYQGGHIEYFKYMYDLLQARKAGHIKIFGGGGGTILPDEIEELHQYGITHIYSPDEGRKIGLQGMINQVVMLSDFPLGNNLNGELDHFNSENDLAVARLITASENFPDLAKGWMKDVRKKAEQVRIPVIGITGTGGAGKSSVTDELVYRFSKNEPEKKIAIISVDPTKRKSGGALLGDRIRMNSTDNPNIYMRSMATRQSNASLSNAVNDAIDIIKAAGFDILFLETSGIGQSDSAITAHANIALYVMTPEFGAASQLEKIEMLDFADLVVVNKADKRGAADALHDVRKQYQRNNLLWEKSLEEMPVFSTVASRFNDEGVNKLFAALILKMKEKDFLYNFSEGTTYSAGKSFIIPENRVRYLAEISETIKRYNNWVNQQKEVAQQLYGINKTAEVVEKYGYTQIEQLAGLKERLEQELSPANKQLIDNWSQIVNKYKNDIFQFTIRGKEINIATYTNSLSGTKVPKVAVPSYEAWGDVLKWLLQENFPGEFPYTAGVFPFKRKEEDPTRMFAGEGGPERTNRRFHYLSKGMPATRLSTAFDSVTLYGQDPDERPDIFGKIGNSGVSVCCLDDVKKLYSGFNLAAPNTSVSITINGPASIITAYFLNAAVDQQCELYIHQNGLAEAVKSNISKIFEDTDFKPTFQGKLPEGNDELGLMLLGVTGDQVLPVDVYNNIKEKTLSSVRGTVQADILKEDQAQNTCIFSTEFSLRLMGDVQEYFIDNYIKNFYSVSISGYHMAEAGANPITQLAFTLANGFTYVEYYLSRGMPLDQFATNLSFFFSNGIDAEYAVIGRVARRIWAKAMKNKYGAGSKSQLLKYHIQTSGRSLHAQEIDFNDIRTTLQALYAIYDNCNSLHTNAYDEAITTPTEESVRRAMAIQLIINKELGLARNENPLQGSFIIEELTDLVEEAVMLEFERLSDRGGVLGAMETMYQRNKIQEESLLYESLKHNGELPIIGVNTFLSSKGSPTIVPSEVIRAAKEEKDYQVKMVRQLWQRKQHQTTKWLDEVKASSIQNKNLFEVLMNATKHCSLGQITNAFFEAGGKYRRNM